MINNQDIPHFVKYMGSKREILDYIQDAILELNVDSRWICDLFAGTSIVACSLKNRYNLHINDIQEYSTIFANTYFSTLNNIETSKKLTEIEVMVLLHIKEFKAKYPKLEFDYSNISEFNQFHDFELKQQTLIKERIDTKVNLFTKLYSGTYWSFEQCLWIDALRTAASHYKNCKEYYAIISSLMYAMSYTSQSTGHFAQYRTASPSNMNDILIYRRKSIWTLFCRKFEEIASKMNVDITSDVKITNLDYVDCLSLIAENSIVYADPPYSTVHYSRFYHALETLVKYDQPVVKYKGRYRENRHQSPFDIKSEVNNAFKLLFEGVKEKKSHLILSYSNNGMISQEEILKIGKSVFGTQYICKVKTKEYIHMKMGRADNHQMEVKELLISYKRK